MKEENFERSLEVLISEGYECMIVPIHEKLLLSVREAAAYSGIGINKIQSLLRMPRCPFVLFVGRKKLIKRRQFEKYLEDSQFI